MKIIAISIPVEAEIDTRYLETLIGHNPGITSGQLCSALNILPPNLFGKISAMEQRRLMMSLRPSAFSAPLR